ncbi:hypothetical protein [Clostridium septicum]|nr:hypothetical protein [Clostridium septicum]
MLLISLYGITPTAEELDAFTNNVLDKIQGKMEQDMSYLSYV